MELTALPLHSGPLPIPSPSLALLSTHPAVFASRLKLLPLIRRQLFPNSEQKTRIRTFKIAPRLYDLVDLGRNGSFVRCVRAHQRLHRQLRLLQVGLQIYQLLPMLQQDAIHRLALIVGQLQPLCDSGIVPPPFVAACRAECPFHGRPAISKPGPHALATTKSLRASRGSCHQ